MRMANFIKTQTLSVTQHKARFRKKSGMIKNKESKKIQDLF